VPVREAAVRPEEFSQMDECMLLSSTKDVAPIASIDDVRFKVGPDTVSLRLRRVCRLRESLRGGAPELRA